MNRIVPQPHALRFQPIDEPVKHPHQRTDVQNIDPMELAGYEEWKSRYQTDRPAA
jgi:hypothetical protein